MRMSRQKQTGRSVDTAFRARSVDRPTRFSWGRPSWRREMFKQYSWRDIAIPKGYRHTSLQKVPYAHQSYKPLQDETELNYKRLIADTPPGPRRDYYIRDYEWWLANGRPTYGSPGTKADKNEWRRTQGKASGVWQDFIEDDHPRRTRRIRVDDMVARIKEGVQR